MGKRYKIILALLLPAALMAGGTTGADILKFEPGGRASGLGGAYAACGNDVESINYNPAGLSSVTLKEFHATHTWSYGSVMAEQFSYAQPMDTAFIEGCAGISGIYRYMPDIANPDATDEPVKYYDFLVKATYASNFAKMNVLREDWAKYINVGASLGLVMEQIASYSGSTIILDLGAQFNFFDTGLKFGAAINNAGLNITHSGPDGASPVPLIVRAGASYNFKIDNDNTMTAVFEYIQNIYDNPRLAIGFEDVVMNLISLRAGYNTSVDTRDAAFLSAGAGIMVNQPGLFNVVINYTYRPAIWGGFNNVEHTHLVSLQVKI